LDAQSQDRNIICLNASLHMVEAMALFEKDEMPESTENFEAGSKVMNKVSGRDYAWENRLIFEILQTEAESKLGN
jgi:hypothetical protein